MDKMLLKYIMELGIYFISFLLSAYAVTAIPFNRFLDHKKPREAMILYIIIVLLMTYFFGCLIIKIVGLEIWLIDKPPKNKP